MAITTTPTIGSKWVLKGIEKLVSWARMNFNASKSRSLVLKKGIAIEKERLKLSGETVPTIQEKSIKRLGKRTDRSLRDTIGWLVCGFYGISTFVGYLTPNPFLCKQFSLA